MAVVAAEASLSSGLNPECNCLSWHSSYHIQTKLTQSATACSLHKNTESEMMMELVTLFSRSRDLMKTGIHGSNPDQQ